MKYPIIKAEKDQVIQVDKLNGGLNISADATQIDDNCLTDCKNVFFDGTCLKTRIGLYTTKSNAIKSSYSSGSDFSDYKIYDTNVCLDGTSYCIATENAESGLSTFYTSIFLINTEGKSRFTGTIQYRRVSDDVFYIPTNITFYQGKPTKGNGIYALVYIANAENYKDQKQEIYELSTTLSEWKRVISFYIPTVYINGRGDSYEKASQSGQAYSGNPTVLEAPNLLSGKFISYFSSDGFSSSFRLPFSSLDEDTVTCRIYSSPKSYVEWSVTAGYDSTVKTFLGIEVTMTADRSKGIIYFTVPAGDFAVPLMSQYKANNIKVTASKTITDGLKDIVSCKKAINFNSRIILTSGAKKNRIYSARYDNPLYFPYGEIAEIGNSSQEITALMLLKNKLFAFNQSESYIINIKNGKAFNTIALVADNSAIFFDYDKFDVSPLNLSIGCYNYNHISVLGNNGFIYANDGNIYSISPSGELKNISFSISPFLKEIADYSKDEFYLIQSDNLLLCCIENYALTAYFDNSQKDEKTSWYVWEFPLDIRIAGGFSQNGSPIILCKKDTLLGYCSILRGNKDIVLANATQTQSHFIRSSFTTKHFSNNSLNGKIRLNKVIMRLKTDNNGKIKINGKNENLSNNSFKTSDTIKNFIFFPSVTCTDSVNISFESKNQFEMGGLKFFYKSLYR